MKKIFLTLIIFGGVFVFSQNVYAVGCCIASPLPSAASPANCQNAANGIEDCGDGFPIFRNGADCSDSTNARYCIAPTGASAGCCIFGTSQTPADTAMDCPPGGVFSPTACTGGGATTTCASKGGLCQASCGTGSPITGTFSDCALTCCSTPTGGATCASQGGTCKGSCDGGIQLSGSCPSLTQLCCGSADIVGCCMLSGGGCIASQSQAACELQGTYQSGACPSSCSSGGGGGGGEGGGGTGGGTGPAGTLNFANPFRVDNITDFVGSVLTSLTVVIALIAIVMIVVGGIMYMASGGNDKTMERAKMVITAALVGLSISLAAPTFLKEIIKIFQGNPMNPGDVITRALTIQQILVRVLDFLLAIVGIVAIISLVIGGGMYLTAYGDEDRAKKGKQIATYAIIGIIISLGALVIVKQVAGFFGLTSY